MTNLRILIVAGIALTAGLASAAPKAEAVSPTLANRQQLIAVRMGTTGESYDRATKAVQSVIDERTEAILAEINKGASYKQARLTVPDRATIVNARWTKHLVAMDKGGAHDAGWAASSQ
jgi:pectin methylesterase-like acyl-CoA thioesterase